MTNMGFAYPVIGLDRTTSGRVNDPGPSEDQDKKEEPLPPEQSKISVEVEGLRGEGDQYAAAKCAGRRHAAHPEHASPAPQCPRPIGRMLQPVPKRGQGGLEGPDEIHHGLSSSVAYDESIGKCELSDIRAGSFPSPIIGRGCSHRVSRNECWSIPLARAATPPPRRRAA